MTEKVVSILAVIESHIMSWKFRGNARIQSTSWLPLLFVSVSGFLLTAAAAAAGHDDRMNDWDISSLQRNIF